MPAAHAIDALVGWFSPQAALKRARARTAIEQLRAYDGAKVGRRTGGWTTTGASANAELVPALNALRNRSRDLVRNNPYAARAIDSLVSAAVGTGIVCTPNEAAAAWQAWVQECDADGQLDFYGVQSLVARTVFESGECLVRLRPRRPEDGLTVPLQLQVLEPDHLDSSRTGPLPGGGLIIAGVEFDALGRRVAYWLYPQHPGEMVYLPKSLQSARVQASAVLHIYEKRRPAQVRGVPRLAASMLRIRDLDDYEEAELVRKGIEACFAAIVTSPDDNPAGVTGTLTDVNGKPVETLAAGLIAYGKPGQQITFGAPQPSSDYNGYTGAQLHAIAAGAGVTYEQMTGDLSQVNYSSIRAGLLDFRRQVESFQWLTLVPMLLAPVWRAFAETARQSGALRKTVEAAQWTMPRWEWVDPLKEVTASREEMAGGLATWSEKIRSRGFDPESVALEMAADIERFRRIGLNDELINRILFETSGAAMQMASQEDTTNGKTAKNRRAA